MNEELYMAQMRKSTVALEDIALQMMVNVSTGAAMPPDTDKAAPGSLLGLIRHCHQYSEIFACTGGQLWLSTENGLLQLDAGDLVVVPSGASHVHIPNLHEKGRGSFAFTGIQRQTSGCQPLYRQCERFFHGEQLQVLRGHPELCTKVTEIIADMQRGAEYLPVLKLAELLLTICELQPGRQFAAAEPGENELSRSAYLEHLINSYFMQSVTAEQIAAKMHVSPRQLARIIQKQHNSTLHEMMMDKRISTAIHLLHTTALTTDEIARIIGFGSRTGFYREFIKRHGVTPAQYRQNLPEQPE